LWGLEGAVKRLNTVPSVEAIRHKKIRSVIEALTYSGSEDEDVSFSGQRSVLEAKRHWRG
jgi:hypothetical protein